MKKLILLAGIIVSVATTTTINAQNIKYGVRAGVGFYNWGGQTGQAISELVDESKVASIGSKPGFSFGLFGSLPINHFMEIESGIGYTQRGMRVRQTLFDNTLINPTVTLSNNSHYLDVPLQFKVNLPSGLHLIAGGQVSYLVSNQIGARAGVLGLSVGRNFDFNNVINEWDAGLTGGIGFTTPYGFDLRAQYDYGLVRLDQYINTNIFNRGFKFTVGYQF